MDTREKIIALDRLPALLERDEWLIVTGLFDLLTAAQAERLVELAGQRRIVAVVLDSEDTLLSAQARATLVAALRSVSNVVISGPASWRALVPESARIQVLEDDAAERARSTEFIQFVLDRNR